MDRVMRILLVDDHPMILAGLAALLADEPGVELVGDAADVDSAVSAALRVKPDLVVLPIRLGARTAGVDLCRRLKATTPTRTLVYTSFTDPEDIEAAVLAGADGFVGKSAAPEDLLAAIRAIRRGQRAWFPDPAPAARRPRRLERVSDLTDREREVLGLMLRRMSNAEIADELCIAVTTVKTHARSVLRKLGMSSRRELFRSGQPPRPS